MNDKTFTTSPMKPEEVLYTYQNSQQISMQTGLIGYLRADLGSNGDSFFSAWNSFRNDLNTPEFNAEMNGLINSLLSDGNILSNRETLRRFCCDGQNALKFGERFGSGRDYGIRINTQDYAYLMRLNPNKGEYDLYCYCYKKNWLDSHIEKAQRGIRFITPSYKEKFRIPDGDKIRIIPDNSRTGNSDIPKDYICRYIDDYHLEVGRNLYHICEFAERMERAENTVIPLRSSLPEQCYVFIEAENIIGIVTKGEAGYSDSKAANGKPSDNRLITDSMNKELGVTKAQTEAMKAGSLLGWDCPAADPKNYNEKGTPIKPKSRSYER